MTDDKLAALLAEAPPVVDPGFRLDVMLEVARRAQRQSVRRRAAINSLMFAGIGVAVAVLGAHADRFSPLVTVIGLGAGVGVLALALIEGPRTLAARTAAVLRLPV